MTVQTFETREQAQAELGKMRGWDAKIGKMTVSDPNDPHRPRDMYVIEVHGYGDVIHLHDDGFVRY